MNKIKEYNKIKEMVLEKSKKVNSQNHEGIILMLNTFVNMWLENKRFKLERSLSIKNYIDIITNSETPEELNQILIDIYNMIKRENVKNNDYIIETKEDYNNDLILFKDEMNKNSELFDKETYDYLKSFKVLNDKFVYLA